MEAEVLVADLARAIKSALVFVGDEDLYQRYAYVRFDVYGTSLVLSAGSRYEVAAVKLDSTIGVLEQHSGPVFIDAGSVKAALDYLKPGRTKPVVKVVAFAKTVKLVRQDQQGEPYLLGVYEDPSPLPPAFAKPLEPINWTESYLDKKVSRFAVAPGLVTKLARAAWNNEDAVIVESGGTPHSPITFRIGTYLIAVLAPKDGRNGNTTTVAPNAAETRRSWHRALTAMQLTRREQGHDQQGVGD